MNSHQSDNGLSRVRSTPRVTRVVIATATIVVIPSVVSYLLQRDQGVGSTIVSIALATVLSLALCQVCGRYWDRRRGANDVLFGDLLVWGYLRRKLHERRVRRSDTLFRFSDAETSGAVSRSDAGNRMKLLLGLVKDLECSDPYTHGHSYRVARYSSLIARRMGLPRTYVRKVRAAAALHDIGKTNTPHEILHKQGRLTDAEFAIMQLHAEDGARMIGQVVEDAELVAIVRSHHERLDGSGYPSRLRGDQIPLGARIIAVADTFDAITSQRPYRPSRLHREALEILRREAGTQLDRDAVDAFHSVYYARRPLAPVVALGNAADRILSGLATRLAAGGRIAGVAATAATVGTIAAGHAPALLANRSQGRTLAAVVRSSAPVTSATAGGRRGPSACCATGPGARGPRSGTGDRVLHGSGRPVQSSSSAFVPVAPPSAGAPPPSAPGASPQQPPVLAAPNLPVQAGVTTGTAGTTATVGATAGPASVSVSAGINGSAGGAAVSVGASGPGGVGAGVTVTTGPAPSVGLAAGIR